MSVADTPLFANGALLGLQRRLGLIRGGDLNVHRRAALIVLVGWAPLVLLTAFQGAGITSLLLEVGAHARYLISAPLLVLADLDCVVRLTTIVHQFVDAGLVPERERARFDSAITSTRKLLCSKAGEMAVVVLAYIVVAAMAYSTPIQQLPAWHRSGGAGQAYSPAGWWHVLVSMPLLFMLLLGWLSRLILWTRMLWLISLLDLRLVASHPDHSAGLGFVGLSVRGFSLVALAMATVVAGRSAHIVLFGGTLPTSHLVFNGGLLLTVAAMFTAPLLVFTPPMMAAWRRAVLQYGALANRMGVTFEDKWLSSDRRLDESALDKTDFTATTDLYAVVANIFEMRLVPIDVKSLVLFASAMALPFVPVVLLTVPVGEILAGLKALLL